MKNSNYFPFERNKYFYGKLLSVDDFELEQKYMNDKRRMLNRFIHGTGVVAGLYVVGVDEQTISVEMGFALDSLGREIVVDTPVVKKLSLVEGFEACRREDTGYVYLCLDYDEKESERVHNIAGQAVSAQEDGNLVYNKIRENYRLFLTSREPENTDLSPADLYEQVQVVFQNEEIKISQIMPRFIQAGKASKLRIQVENLGRKNLSFSYELVLNRLLSGGQARAKVSFDEMLFERTGHYEFTCPLESADVAGVEGTAVIDPQSVRMSCSGVACEAHMEGKSTTQLVKDDEKEELIRDYYRTAMEKIVRDGYQQPVYLARIFMVKAADTYIIEKIENVPFGQYVYNNVLESAVSQMMRKERLLYAGGGASDGDGMPHGDAGGGAGLMMAQGVCDIHLGGGGQRGERFFSDEIMHGLGLGKVTVVLGIEKEEGCIISGSSEVFEPSAKNSIEAELAACQNPDSGSFVIGLRLIAQTTQPKARVHWTAFKDTEEAVREKSDRRIFIKPNLLELNVRQSYYLEAVCENMIEKAVAWSVKDEGGTIDENGMYTAPNVPGVYEIMAKSVAFPDVRASIFVIVREL